MHAYTALGNICAFLAAIAATNHHAQLVFIYLSLAILIDGTDGALARACQVTRWTPRFDGRKLDDITDYLTYVFIPMFFAYEFQLVTGPWLVTLAIVILASAFGFCQDWAKTDDGFFTGFPSYWNVVVFYMFLLGTPAAVNGLVLAGLALLVFVPIRYIYPSKMKTFRPLTLALGAVWAVLGVWLIFTADRPDPVLVWTSLLYPAYYLGLSFYLHLTSPPSL